MKWGFESPLLHAVSSSSKNSPQPVGVLNTFLLCRFLQTHI